MELETHAGRDLIGNTATKETELSYACHRRHHDHRRHRVMSDLNDQYPDDDADVIAGLRGGAATFVAGPPRARTKGENANVNLETAVTRRRVTDFNGVHRMVTVIASTLMTQVNHATHRSGSTSAALAIRHKSVGETFDLTTPRGGLRPPIPHQQAQ
jgi:hypothetical protein